MCFVPLPAGLNQPPIGELRRDGPRRPDLARTAPRWPLRPRAGSVRAHSRHVYGRPRWPPRTSGFIAPRRRCLGAPACGGEPNSAGGAAGERRSGGSTISEQLIKLAQPRPRTLWSKCSKPCRPGGSKSVWTKDRSSPRTSTASTTATSTSAARRRRTRYFISRWPTSAWQRPRFSPRLPQSPTRLNPYRHLDRARKRQRWVLQRMAANGDLGADELQRASVQPLRLSPSHGPSRPRTSWIWTLAHGGGDLPAAADKSGEIRTTLDLGLNRFIADRLRQHLAGCARNTSATARWS